MVIDFQNLYVVVENTLDRTVELITTELGEAQTEQQRRGLDNATLYEISMDSLALFFIGKGLAKKVT